METKYAVRGFFITAEGARKEFVSMRMPATRERAFKYEREVARKLRDEGCTSVILKTRPL